MQTYLFYDLETTGLNHAFDQVLQFAAVRTDMQFVELERHEIMIKLRSDVIPSPAATAAHCISTARVADGLCEYEAMQQIHAMLNTPGTISLGYNSLRFDDEFLRFAFYRNLLTPYTHQYANQCSRMDLLPIVVLFRLLGKEALQWPEVDGKVSLKLENLKAANDLAEGDSHDALVDVETTVALARRLSKEQALWSFGIEHFNKAIDQRRAEQLPIFSPALPEYHKLGLLLSPGFGTERNYQAPVLSLGNSSVYNNQSLWLRLDRPELMQATAENIEKNTWVVRKKFGDSGIILSPKDDFMQGLDSEHAQILQNNKQWLEKNPELLQKMVQYHSEFRYGQVPEADVDTILYQSDFYSRDEVEMCRQFHSAPLQRKIDMAKSFHRRQLHDLGSRLLFRNYGDQIGDAFSRERQEYDYRVNPVFEQEALIDYRGKQKLTPGAALVELADLRARKSLNKKQQSALLDLEKYIKNNFPEAAG